MPKYVLPKAFVGGQFVLQHVVEIPKGTPVPAGAELVVEKPVAEELEGDADKSKETPAT